MFHASNKCYNVNVAVLGTMVTKPISGKSYLYYTDSIDMKAYMDTSARGQKSHIAMFTAFNSMKNVSAHAESFPHSAYTYKCFIPAHKYTQYTVR